MSETTTPPGLAENPWLVEVGALGTIHRLYFSDEGAAANAYAAINGAARAWNARGNEREQHVEVSDNYGALTIDVLHMATCRKFNRYESDMWRGRIIEEQIAKQHEIEKTNERKD